MSEQKKKVKTGQRAREARAMVEEYKAQGKRISIRTAYRHLAKGTKPYQFRHIGRDGKSHPAKKSTRSWVAKELYRAYNALNRADNLACQQNGINAFKGGVTNDDMMVLLRILNTAQDMRERWLSVLPEMSAVGIDS